MLYCVVDVLYIFANGLEIDSVVMKIYRVEGGTSFIKRFPLYRLPLYFPYIYQLYKYLSDCNETILVCTFIGADFESSNQIEIDSRFVKI